MIENLKLSFQDEKGRDCQYQYGSFYLVIKNKKKAYKQIQISNERIIELKTLLQNQIQILLDQEIQEVSDE